MQARKGYFGEYGGAFAPETLLMPLDELEQAFNAFQQNAQQQAQLQYYLQHYIGRPTPLYFAERLSKHIGNVKVYLKREDLTHTGAHKINNAIAQALLAKYMGKTRLIAETGAGQHGVAVATVASLLQLECTIYMGEIDMKRQALNVARMQALGATVEAVTHGQRTLVDATSNALRDWITNIKTTYYVLGSALGPHPYPTIVREFQKIIGQEARAQILEILGKLPNELVACVGGGSNAIGLFHAFLNDREVKMTGVEGGGNSLKVGQHAARFATGRVGVLQGTRTMILQNEDGLIHPTHSISAGLDYPGVGPEHAYYKEKGRIQYTYAQDSDALKAAMTLARLEGILPALESAHALAYLLNDQQFPEGYVILVNLSGRGDKDMQTYKEHLNG